MWKEANQKKNDKYMCSALLHIFKILFEMLLDKHG